MKKLLAILLFTTLVVFSATESNASSDFGTVVTVPDGKGGTTELFCWESEGYVFCE